MRVYEGMFLMDPALAADFPKAEAEVNRILGRADAKVLGIKKWDERRLAYPIKRHKRGLYVLSFFEAGPDKIADLERDVQLSETALRVLVLQREGITAEGIEKAMTAEPPPKAPARGEDWRGPRRPSDRDDDKPSRRFDGDNKGPRASGAFGDRADDQKDDKTPDDDDNKDG